MVTIAESNRQSIVSNCSNNSSSIIVDRMLVLVLNALGIRAFKLYFTRLLVALWSAVSRMANFTRLSNLRSLICFCTLTIQLASVRSLDFFLSVRMMFFGRSIPPNPLRLESNVRLKRNLFSFVDRIGNRNAWLIGSSAKSLIWSRPFDACFRSTKLVCSSCSLERKMASSCSSSKISNNWSSNAEKIEIV